MWGSVGVFATLVTIVVAQKNPHYVDDRSTMVHLFEWKYSDIAKECEDFLGPKGYGGVQVSPINENIIINERPWYERYQPISYDITTRSGNESEFIDMVRRCNNVDVRIVVDAVINHMTADITPSIGTGGSTAEPEDRSYPAVPFDRNDFHTPCQINDYNNATNVRDCELEGLHDLDQSKKDVREKIIKFLNKAVDAGVAGFRIDAAKHMWPEDLKAIYEGIKDLNEKAGFPPKSRPFIFQEVIDLGGEAVSKYEYTDIGRVIEFQYGIVLGYMFRGKDNLKRLENWGTPEAWRLLKSEDALVMIDNHDNQRGHGAGGTAILTHKDPKLYKTAVAFMLAHPYGLPRVMSSYEFDDPSTGPPADLEGQTLSPEIGSDGLCKNGWVCEHRWPQIYRMVLFRAVAKNEKLENWWTNGDNQIAFSRGSNAFAAFNSNPDSDLRELLQTGLESGIYCDVITGTVENGECTGKAVEVYPNGTALIEILKDEDEGALAIHIAARLE